VASSPGVECRARREARQPEGKRMIDGGFEVIHDI
jgi:hypothetical protein